MIYESDTLKVQRHDGGIAELLQEEHDAMRAVADDLDTPAALAAVDA